MTRDYKHRVQPAGGRRNKHKQQSPVSIWKWLAAALLVAVFILFLVNLRSHTPKINSSAPVVQLPVEKQQPTKKKAEVKVAKPEAEGPDYQFYTILPEQGEMIPDHEIKKLKRAETLGKPPEPSRYVLQAGSFRDFAQADKVKARLALLGIQAKIEVAAVGNTNWNRVKLGPYPNMRSVDHVRSKLRKAGVETVVFRE